jgi:hypothetical protein
MGEFDYSLEVSRLPGTYNTGDRDNTEPVAVAWVRGGFLFHKYRNEEPMVEAYVFRAKLVEDFDGSPTAYGWDRPDSDFAPSWMHKPGESGYVNVQKNLHPLEGRRWGQKVGLENAASPFKNLWHGHDFTWVGVVSATEQQAAAGGFMIDDRPDLRDKHGKFPVVQPLGAPAPGYYVSQNPTIVDKGKPWWDQRRYADGNTFPYIVLNNQFISMGARIGDVGLAIHPATGKSEPFVFGDTGTFGHLGESSSYLYQRLTAGKGNSGYFTFLVFPKSGFHNTEGLNAKGAVEFRLTNMVTTIRATNAYELPMLLALGGDLARFNHARKQPGAGADSAMSTPGYFEMTMALAHYGFMSDD